MLGRTERSTVRAVCAVRPKDRKRLMDFVFNIDISQYDWLFSLSMYIGGSYIRFVCV